MESWQSLVECTGLENQQGFTPFGGSNPSLSTQNTKSPFSTELGLLNFKPTAEGIINVQADLC